MNAVATIPLHLLLPSLSPPFADLLLVSCFVVLPLTPPPSTLPLPFLSPPFHHGLSPSSPLPLPFLFPLPYTLPHNLSRTLAELSFPSLFPFSPPPPFFFLIPPLPPLISLDFLPILQLFGLDLEYVPDF